MLFGLSASVSANERQLLAIFKSLDVNDQGTLMAFAEFLQQRTQPSEPIPLPTPQLIPRPDHESVIKAMKRLRASYPMLDQASLLNGASSLMTEHIMQGRAASEVIDELERLFAQHYQTLQSAQVAKDNPA